MGKHERSTAKEKLWHHAINQLDSMTNGSLESDVIAQYHNALEGIHLNLQELASY